MVYYLLIEFFCFPAKASPPPPPRRAAPPRTSDVQFERLIHILCYSFADCCNLGHCFTNQSKRNWIIDVKMSTLEARCGSNFTNASWEVKVFSVPLPNRRFKLENYSPTASGDSRFRLGVSKIPVNISLKMKMIILKCILDWTISAMSPFKSIRS